MLHIGCELLKAAVDHSSQLVGSGYPAIGDGQISGRPGVSERKARLGADAVVPRRIYRAVGNAHILAAVNVHAIAVGVDGEIVDSEVVDSRKEKSEVAALENGEVAEQHVAAILERDGLVPYARLFGNIDWVIPARIAPGAKAQAAAVDETRS